MDLWLWRKNSKDCSAVSLVSHHIGKEWFLNYIHLIQVQPSLRILFGTVVFMPIDNIICFDILFAPKKNISNMSFNNETLLSLFYCFIGGRVIYASEIWGAMSVYVGLGRVPMTYTRLYTCIEVRCLLAIIV